MKFFRRVPKPRFAALIILSAIWGCSPINLQSAVLLGNTGVQSATSYEQAVSEISPGLDNFMEGQFLLAALDPEKFSPPTDSLRQSVDQLQSAISARATLLGQLAQVYAGFIALASYDASDQVKTSLSGLDGAINQYAAVLGAGRPAIPPVADAVISNTGGLLAREYQKRAVLKASKAISARLAATSALLASENSLYARLQEEITRGLRDSALVLWGHGVGAPDVILAEQIGAFGLTYSPGLYSHACESERIDREKCEEQFKTAIAHAIRYRASRMATLQTETMISNQSALTGLIAAHKQFEQGEPLNVAAVTEQLALVRGIIDQINDAQQKKL